MRALEGLSTSPGRQFFYSLRSAQPVLLRRPASNKWRLERCNPLALLKTPAMKTLAGLKKLEIQSRKGCLAKESWLPYLVGGAMING
ncbi:MAG TPA: hypothetical protein VFR94_05455 [Nitrososphaeraceae archaeon]|nr:hypothetical protein [Nitrososphaeraceae archaeon]